MTIQIVKTLVFQEACSIKSLERNKMTNTVMTAEAMQLFNADYREIPQQGRFTHHHSHL